MNLETLVLELVADDSKLSRDIDAAVKKATKKLATIEKMGAISPSVDLDSLHELNKLLDVKQDHLGDTIDFFNANEIQVGVDGNLVEEVKESLKELREERNKSEFGVRSSGGESRQSSKGGYESGTLFNEVEQKLTGEIKKVIGKVGDIATAPLAGIGRGFFEGFGQVISKELSEGFLGILDSDLNLNLKDVGQKAADATIDYAFPTIKDKKAQKARVKQYQDQMQEVDELISSISKVASSSGGLSQEKDTIGKLKNQSKQIKENLKAVESNIGAKGLPSNADVLAMGQQVNSQIEAIAKLSATLNAVSGTISKKLMQYRESEKLVSQLSSRLDMAVNANDYQAVRQVKNDISKQIKNLGDVDGDTVLMNYRDQLIQYQKSAKLDSRLIAKTSDKPGIRDYLMRPKTSMELMAEKGKIAMEDAQIGASIVEGGKALMRGAVATGKGLYGALDAAEGLALGPARHVVKPIIQGTVAAAGLPMLASMSPVIAPVAGALNAVGGLGGGLAGHAVSGSMAGIANIPMIGGQIATVAGQIVTGAGTFATEMVAAAVAINTFTGSVKKFFTNSPFTNAIAPAKDQPKALQAANQVMSNAQESWNKIKDLGGGSIKGLVANKDKIMPLLPEAERQIVERFAPRINTMQDAYAANLLFQQKYQEATGKDLALLGKSNKQLAKLPQQEKGRLQELIETQLRPIYAMLQDFTLATKNIEGMSNTGVINTMASAIGQRKSLLEGKARAVGLSDKDLKAIEAQVVMPEVPDLSQMPLSNKANKAIEQNWEKTKKAVQADMVEITATAEDQAYPLQRNMSEGSPGPTDWIRKNWEKTAKFVNKQIESITANAAKLFAKGDNQAGRIGIDYEKFPIPQDPISANQERHSHFNRLQQQIDNEETRLMSRTFEPPSNADGQRNTRRTDYNINQKELGLNPWEYQGYNRPRINAGARKELINNINSATSRDELEVLRRDVVHTVNKLKDVKQKINESVSKIGGDPTLKQQNTLNRIDKEIENINKTFSRKFGELGADTGDIVASGTEEYYDNFFGNIKQSLVKKLNLKGDMGENLIDQIMTFTVAGASTFAPGLAPAVAAAPLFMPLIPGAIASVAVGSLVAPIVQRIDQALMQQEPIKQRFTTLEGNPVLGQAKQQQITDIANKYSIPVEPAVQNFSQMAIAAQNTNLTGQEMMDLFEGISASIRALGLSTQDADLIFMAYTQMLAKGKISMEELRQQLGERFPPAMSVFAKALNTTTAGLDEMVSRGAIGTEKWVTSVTKVLKEDFGSAALAMGDNYMAASSRLENINFKINKNFADTYGGLFTFVKNTWGNMLNFLADNFQILNALAVSGLIAVWASIGIGISYIMKTPAIANMAKGGSNLLFSVFKNSLGTLTPFLIGVLADVMDDIFNTENNLMENMSKGVTNMFVAAFGGVDRVMRDSGMGALFDPYIARGNPFQSIIDGVSKLVNAIPSGLIEMTSLILMFEQVRVLGRMFVVPTFQAMGTAIMRWGKSVKDAVLNAQTMKRTIGDLFGGTLIALGGVSRDDVLKQFSGEFGTLRKGLDADLDMLTQYKQKREAIIKGYQQDYMKATGSPISRDKAITDNQQQLRELKRQYSQQREALMGEGDFANKMSPERDALVRYQTQRDELLNRRMKKMAAQRLAMGSAMIAAEAGIAVAMMAFARSDFSNTIEAEANKARKSFIGSVDAMKAALKTLETQGAETAKTLSTIKLPSKGLELNLEAIFLGRSEKSFKSDDAILQNREALKQLADEYERLVKLSKETNNPFLRVWAELNKPISRQNSQSRIDASQRLGIADYYPQQTSVTPTIAEDQFLDTVMGFEQEYKNVIKEISKDNNIFDVNDLSKPLTANALNAVKQVQKLDAEMKAKQDRRSILGLENTAESRAEIRKLDQELNTLLKTRKELAKPFVELDSFSKDLDNFVTSQTSAIENSGLPIAAQRKAKEQLEPIKRLAEDIKSYFAGQGITQIAKPLEDAWDRIVNKIQDVESALNRVKAANAIELSQANVDIYGQGGGNLIVNRKIQESTLEGAKKDYEILAQTLRQNEQALAEALSISNVGDSSEKRSKIEELRGRVRDQSVELANAASSIAKAEYDLSQDFALDDYFRNTARQIEDLNFQIQSQQIQDQRSLQDLSFQVQDASVSLQRSNRALGEAYQDMAFDFNVQVATVSKAINDAQDQLELTQLRINNLSITPGNSGSIARQIDDILLRYSESVFGTQSNERQIKIDILNLEKERIQRLRQIRDFEERQMDATRDFARQIITLQRAFFDLERNMKQAAIGFIRQIHDMTREMGRNDNSSPRAIELRNQLQAVPQYNPRMVLPAPTGQVARPVMIGRESATPINQPIDPVPSDHNRVQSQVNRSMPVTNYAPGDPNILEDAMRQFGGFPATQTTSIVNPVNPVIPQRQQPQIQSAITPNPIAFLTPSEYNQLRQMVAAEATNEGVKGMAAVSRSILNRLALLQSGKAPLGTAGYGAKSATLQGVLMARTPSGKAQYSPVDDGRFYKQFSQSVLSQADQAIQASLSDSKMMQLGLGSVLNATNFQTTNLRIPDWWQGGVNRVGNHNFSRDKYSTKTNASQQLYQIKGQNNLQSSLNFGVNPGEVDLGQYAQLGGFIQGVKNFFGGGKKDNAQTLRELAEKFAQDQEQFLDGANKFVVAKRLAEGTFHKEYLQSAFNKLAKSKGLTVPTVQPGFKSPQTTQTATTTTRTQTTAKPQTIVANNPANVAVPMAQRMNLAKNFMQMYVDALGSTISKKDLQKLVKDLAEYRSTDKQLQTQFERYVGRTPDERMVDIANFQKAKQQRQVAKASTVQAQASMQQRNATRPLGSQSIINGKPVYWAGEDWKWQSESSYRKLQQNNFQRSTPSTIKAQATITQASQTQQVNPGNIVSQPVYQEPEVVYYPQPQQDVPFIYQESAPLPQDYNPYGFYEPGQDTVIGGNTLQAPTVQPIQPLLSKAATLENMNDTLIELRNNGVKAEALLNFVQMNDSLNQFIRGLQDAELSSTRNVKDTTLSINQLVESSKGWLTITQKVNRAGSDTFVQYDNQIRTLSDTIRDKERLLQDSGSSLIKLEAQIDDAVAQGFDASNLESQKQKLANLIESERLNKNSLQALLNQVTATQNIAVANAKNNAYLQEQLNYLDKMAGLAASISSARYDLGGSLINEAPILQARVAMATAEQRAILQGRNDGLDGQALAEYVGMSKELASINYQKSFTDAIPFVKELGANLKEAVFETNNFTEAFSKLLRVMASDIFDRLVLMPLTNMGSQWLGETFNLGSQTIPTLTGSLAVGNEIVNNPTVSDDGQVKFEPFNQAIETVAQTSQSYGSELANLTALTTTQVVTEQAALNQFVMALQMATQSLYQFAVTASSGGVSGGVGSVFGTIGKLFSGSVSSLAGDFIPSNVIGVDSSISLPAFANGLTEQRMTGRKPMLAIVNEGEAILSTLNGDAQKFQALKRSGTWDDIPNFANGIDRFYSDSRNYNGNWSMDAMMPSTQTSQAISNQRNQVVNKFSQNYTIVTPNADSFRKSQSQIQDEGARTYRRKMR